MTNETSPWDGRNYAAKEPALSEMRDALEMPADETLPMGLGSPNPSEVERARWMPDGGVDMPSGSGMPAGSVLPTGIGVPESTGYPAGGEVPLGGPVPAASPMPNSFGYADSGVNASNSTVNPGANTGSNGSPSFVPPGNEGSHTVSVPSGAKSGWVKPALVGGLVGALLSSAVLGTALVATRKENSKVATPSLPSATTTSGTATSGKVGTPKDLSTTPLGSVIDPKLPPPLRIREVLSAVQPAVVSIATQSGFALNEFDPSGAGTGMVVTPDGYILTNNHVIPQESSVKVTFSDRKVRNAVVVGRDPSNDVALIKVEAKNLPTVKLGSSKALQVGDQVVAIGNALALPGGPTVTTGIVSALNRSLEGDGETLEGLVQTDAAINPGNSGGPLVNTSGEVVGMNTAIIRNTANIGFSIASDRISPILEKLKKNAVAGADLFKPRTFLGVTMYELTPDMVDRFGLGTDKGVLVTDVNIGSPADNAGLQAGDVVVKFDGKTVTKSEDLKTLVQAKKPGDVVVVEWVTRDRRKMSASIELGSARRVAPQPLPTDDRNENPLFP
jgi:serine protease Do